MPNESSSVLDRELESFERLTADISSRFSYQPVDELPGAIEETLHRVVDVLDVDRSSIFELAENRDAVDAMHFWARPDVPPLRPPDTESLAWYFARLRRGELVRFADVDRELPAEATRERSYARQTGMKSNLTIPVSIGGRLVCALAVGTFRHHREWPIRWSSASGSLPRSSGARSSDADMSWRCAPASRRSGGSTGS